MNLIIVTLSRKSSKKFLRIFSIWTALVAKTTQLAELTLTCCYDAHFIGLCLLALVVHLCKFFLQRTEPETEYRLPAKIARHLSCQVTIFRFCKLIILFSVKGKDLSESGN